jgi:hypothetical protein
VENNNIGKVWRNCEKNNVKKNGKEYCGKSVENNSTLGKCGKVVKRVV